jgi:zinc transport system permease protein
LGAVLIPAQPGLLANMAAAVLAVADDGSFLYAVRHYSFMQYALVAGLLTGVACGIMGSYVVVRRITYVAGGISHCILGGIGAALFMQKALGWEWAHTTYGAIVSALLSAIIIGFVSLRAKQREDTIISAMWAIGMAIGVLFIKRTPGYAQDLMSFLFGNILMVGQADIWLIVGLDILVILVGLLFYHQLQAVCFDQEFAHLRGIRVDAYYFVLLCLTALTVVVLVPVVGVVMVIALLTLPAAVAGQLGKRLWSMMALATVFSIAFTTVGLAISYRPDLPAGATIVVLAGAAYLVVIIFRRLFRRIRAA